MLGLIRNIKYPSVLFPNYSLVTRKRYDPELPVCKRAGADVVVVELGHVTRVEGTTHRGTCCRQL